MTETRITVDDLRRKAERIGEMAKEEVRYQAGEEFARNVAIAAVAVGLAISFAFYLGTRRACGRA